LLGLPVIVGVPGPGICVGGFVTALLGLPVIVGVPGQGICVGGFVTAF
jgi:hypothetical protein